jgi:hypothetical protein
MPIQTIYPYLPVELGRSDCREYKSVCVGMAASPPSALDFSDQALLDLVGMAGRPQPKPVAPLPSGQSHDRKGDSPCGA